MLSTEGVVNSMKNLIEGSDLIKHQNVNSMNFIQLLRTY